MVLGYKEKKETTSAAYQGHRYNLQYGLAKISERSILFC